MKPLQDELVEAKAKIGRLESELKTTVRQGAEPPPETASGGTGKGLYNNLTTARAAHADGKIDNDEMRRAKLTYRS